MSLVTDLRRLSFGLLFSLTVTSLAFAGSGDWPQWRGPNRDGLSAETGLLKAWPKDGPPLVWKATGLGAGFSSLALAGDHIYATGDKGLASQLFALNRADGKQLWSVKIGKAGAPGWGDFAGPRSTPTADGDLVFVIGQFGELAAIETGTGKEKWRKHLVRDFGGNLPEWGYSESPLVDGDKVVCTPGGSKGAVVALNKQTGATVWQSKGFTDDAHYSSLLRVEMGGVRQYIQLTEASLVGLAAEDGHVLWHAKRTGATAVIPTPIYHENHFYVTSGYGVGCNLFKITPSGVRFKVDEVYANKIMVNHHGGVVLVGDHVYGYSDSKGWTCQDFKTGKLIWQEKDKLGKGAVTYSDGRLYLRSEDGKGTVALIEATPQGYKEYGRFDPSDRSDKNSWSHPVVAGSKLYLRDQDVLLCYDVKEK